MKIPKFGCKKFGWRNILNIRYENILKRKSRGRNLYDKWLPIDEDLAHREE
jgi:hypothetical protein